MTTTRTTTAEAAAHPVIARLDAVAQRHDVAYRGRSVCWRRFGDGPPLVLLHGGHGSWMHWVRNIEALAAEHTVWVPDLPGFGDSDPVDADDRAPQRLELLVDATLATLDTLVGRQTPVDMAAFSFGGLVAAHVAAQRGQVRRLALIGSTGHGGRRRLRAPLVNWRLPERDAMLRALEHNLAALMLHEQHDVDDLAMAVHEASCRRTRFHSKELSQAEGLQQILAPLPQPMLFVWGEHDVTGVPEEIAVQLTERHSDREWCVIPGAGHWVQYERADEVNRMLATWFGRPNLPTD